MEEKQITIREWGEGETLDSLVGGEVVRLTDGWLAGNIDHLALYVGKIDSKFVLLAREHTIRISVDEDREKTMVRWKISGRGEFLQSLFGNYKYFKFEGDKEDEDYLELIEEPHPEYQELNREISEKGL